jgi:SAM-dependent methyltransferase
VRAAKAGAATLLDVACGTGEHDRILVAEHGFQVDGVDLDAALLSRARSKNPSGTYVQADMRGFDLGRTYDAVVCLFSAIGYALTMEGLRDTIAAMRRHLGRDGVLVIEPWFTPDALQDGAVDLVTAENARLKVCRMSRLKVSQRRSVVHFEYLVGRRGIIEHEHERHELGLFSPEEMLEALRAAGLDASFQEQGLGSRGLYVGHPARAELDLRTSPESTASRP